MKDISDLPPLPALTTFEAFGRIKGIRGTAQALGVDPAAVTRHLQAIEAWFGIPLIDRSRHPADLNDRARAFHAQVSQAFSALRGASDALKGVEDNHHLRITCAHGLAHRWLIHRLHLFKASYPEIILDFRPTDAIDYGEDAVDLDIRFFVGDDRSALPQHVRAHKLVDCPAQLVASGDFIARLPDSLTPQDLLQQPLLDCEGGQWWEKWFASQGLELGDCTSLVNCWHMDIALSMARRGDGITLVNRFIAPPGDATSGLKSIEDRLVGAAPLHGTYRLVAARGRSSWRSTRAFYKWLLAEMRHG